MRIAGALMMSVLLAASAAAADTETYAVEGTKPDGTPYKGTVAITELNDVDASGGDAFDVVYTIDGKTSDGAGLLSPDRKILTISFVGANGKPGVVSLAQTDGGAEGVWLIDGDIGTGTEKWSKAVADAPPPAAPGEITYERAVECAAVTSYVVGMLRTTPGADQAKIAAYDQANSQWIFKIGDLPGGEDMNANIAAIQTKQQTWANDPDGLSKATPIADECVATAPPM